MGAVTADGYNHISGLSYDASGNTQTDGNNTYTWDGESQLKTAAGVTYSYDGDGRRAAKVGSKLYWYGSGGEILSETDASGNTLNDYIFFGGKRVAMVPASGSALYYAEDTLGSSRVIVQSNGTLCYDADFTPFGGERTYTSTCAQNYKFEGKERDSETQNDDFGARYYSWRIGRWLSSDWSAVPVPVPYANLSNPQTLNLYAMVADDPESFADLDGHQSFWYEGKSGTQDADGCRAAAITCSYSESQGEIGFQNQQTLSQKSEDAIKNSRMTSKQASQFEAAVLRASAQYGIDPNILVGLAFRESTLNPNSGNKSGPRAAKGLFQLLPSQRKEMGLSRRDAFSIMKVVDAVAKTLSERASSFNSLDLAIASWTLGRSGTSKLFQHGGMDAVRGAYLDAKHKNYGTVGPYIDGIKEFSQ